MYLARKGFMVLAGVRKEKDAQALKGAFVCVYMYVLGRFFLPPCMYMVFVDGPMD